MSIASLAFILFFGFSNYFNSFFHTFFATQFFLLVANMIIF